MTTIYPEAAARALAGLNRFFDQTQKPTSPILSVDQVDKESVAQILAQAKDQGQTELNEAQTLEILEAYQFPLLKRAKAKSAPEALALAQKIGPKLVLKIISPDILHKTEVGGVRLNVTAENIESEFNQLIKEVSRRAPSARIEGVLLMEMAPAGTELIAGANQTQGLGTTIMLGLGGIYVEVLRDVSLSFAPLTQLDAIHLIESLRSRAIFDGVRGQKALDRAKIIDCLGRVSQLVTDFPEIKELDINPLLALSQGEGVRVLDARLVL